MGVEGSVGGAEGGREFSTNRGGEDGKIVEMIVGRGGRGAGRRRGRTGGVIKTAAAAEPTQSAGTKDFKIDLFRNVKGGTPPSLAPSSSVNLSQK